MGFPGSILLAQGDELVQSATKIHPLGTRGYTKDGRVFRYAKAGATALAVGKLMTAEAPDGDYNEDLCPDTATAPTTASTAITLQVATGVTIAENECRDGYLYINDGTGQGQYALIEGNEAESETTSGIFDVYIAPNHCFTVAPTTSCEMGMIKNKYDDVVVRSAAATAGVALGVPPRTVTANYYFWLQTWGPCPMLLEGASTVGRPLFCDTLSATANDGSVHPVTTSTDAIQDGGQGMCVGVAMNSSATTEYGLVDLRISP